MENVILIIHLILALCLIGIVLLQRSEDGGLGLGGGGGGAISSRAAATALGKLTWGFAILFIATSITLTVLAAQKSGNSSVIKSANTPAPTAPANGNPALPALPPVGNILPPTTSTQGTTPTQTAPSTQSAPATQTAPTTPPDQTAPANSPRAN